MIKILFCLTVYHFVLLESLSCQPARPLVFETAFLQENSGSELLPFKFHTYDLGSLSITSGKLILSDLNELRIVQSLREEFPKGQFLVQLATAQSEDGGDFLAYGRVVFSSKDVSHWEYASTDKFSRTQICDTTYHWYGHYVESGSLCLTDSATYKMFNRKVKSSIGNRLLQRLNKADRKGLIMKIRKGDIAVFREDHLDFFEAFIGYDAEGQICRLLIDVWMLQLPRSMFCE